MLAIEDWHLRDAYVLCKGNVETDGPITYLPLYMTMFLKPERIPESFVYAPDLSALR